MNHFLSRCAAVAAVAALAGCIPAFQGAGPKIGWQGDSISDYSRDEIHAQLDPIRSLSLYAHVGDRIDQQLALAQEYATSGAVEMVIELGTNDVGLNDPYQADVDTMLATVAGMGCVWWINEATRNPDPAVQARAAALNQYLADAQATHPNLRVLDWRTFSAGQPWFADYVHPNQAGQDALAAWVRTAVDSGCT